MSRSRPPRELAEGARLTATQAPASRIAGIERWAPGIRAARTYQRSWLSRDLIAGIVLVTLLVPQGMAYAELAGLPAITGLYTTVVCLVAYAARRPVASPGAGARLLARADDRRDHPAARRRQRTAGYRAWRACSPSSSASSRSAPALLKLGFVADLLSNPVRTGYLAGLAVVIFIGQLPKLFGFSTDASGLVGGDAGLPRGRARRSDQPVGAGHRTAEPGHHPGAQDGSHRGRPASSSRSSCPSAFGRAGPGRPWRIGHRRAAPGVPAARIPDRTRRLSDLPLLWPRRWASRWSPSVTPSRPRAASPAVPDTRSTATRSSRASGRRTSPPDSSRVPGEHQRVPHRRRLPVRRQDTAHGAGGSGPGAVHAAVRPGPRPVDAPTGARRGGHQPLP